MGRGKIEIKKIENKTNRQVTYSKRRNGIFKKAEELAVLCDAKVSLIMLSNNSKLHEYSSPNTTTKSMYDQYQRTIGCDLWSSQYESMQGKLRDLKETNNKLRTEIRQRMGEQLNDMNLEQLHTLEQKMANSVAVIRDRKYHVLKTQTDTFRKKVRNMEERYGTLVLDFEAKCEVDHPCELAVNEGDYESAAAFANGVSNLYAFRLHPNHPGLSHAPASFMDHDLRLA